MCVPKCDAMAQKMHEPKSSSPVYSFSGTLEKRVSHKALPYPLLIRVTFSTENVKREFSARDKAFP